MNDNNSLKSVQTLLLWHALGSIIIALVLVTLSETDILPTGYEADDKTADFTCATIMELITICVIPFAVWMFRWSRIKKRLMEEQEKALLRYGLIRQYLLMVPMVVNTILYYAFMNVAYGYMGIILFLSIFFIWPSMARCQMELDNLKNDEHA